MTTPLPHVIRHPSGIAIDDLQGFTMSGAAVHTEVMGFSGPWGASVLLASVEAVNIGPLTVLEVGDLAAPENCTVGDYALSGSTLPEGFRPTVDVTFNSIISGFEQGSDASLTCHIESNGEIEIGVSPHYDDFTISANPAGWRKFAVAYLH